MNSIIQGDCREVMAGMDEQSVHMVATSPPYWGLRVYDGCPESVWGGDKACHHSWGEAQSTVSGNNRNGIGGHIGGEGRRPNNPDISGASATCQKCGAWRGQLGLEPTVEAFIEHLMLVMDEVWRVLRDDGVCFVNLGDTHSNSGGRTGTGKNSQRKGRSNLEAQNVIKSVGGDIKIKSLCLVPQRFAIAAQARGWIIRNEIIWHKPNPMPSSATDRCTVAHETIWMMTKKPQYFWDQEAIREPNKQSSIDRDAYGYSAAFKGRHTAPGEKRPHSDTHGQMLNPSGANARDVWTIATQPYAEAHFATWPEKLVRRMILAGSPTKCCEACGAGWARVVEKSGGTTGKSWHPHSDDKGKGMSQYSGLSGGVGNAKDAGGKPYTVEVKGFTPTCACVTHRFITKAIVLDPFAGSCTTGLVALQNDRDCVMIEASEKYAELGRKRMKPGIENPTLWREASG